MVVEGKRTKLYLHLKKWLEKAVMDYGMIAEGDRLLVGVSGGKDSLALLDLLNSSMVYVPSFSLLAVHIDCGFDQSYGGHDTLEAHFRAGAYEYVIEKTQIGPLSHSAFNRKNPCFLCSRLRRKRIFEIAAERGCNRIAFAHHRDDIIETLLINLFYGREISTMLPDQTVFGGKLHIIRPLAYIREELVKKYADERGFRVVENGCPSSRTSCRRVIKDLIDEMEVKNPQVRDNIWKALGHVKTDYLPRKIDWP